MFVKFAEFSQFLNYSFENFMCNLSQILQLKPAELKVNFENLVFQNFIVWIVKVLAGKNSFRPDSMVTICALL